ncbi:MAG: ferrochelatase [Burkholderiaceae bacterium]|nr:ferrochelatase [Burkholderiaceae bacterium]
MARFTANASFTHRTPPLTAVVLVQLGTPDEPAAAPVRRYLRQFLSDPRVVEIPRPVWWPILNGIVLNTRPRKSAAKYRTVWSASGSPLLVHTQRQSVLLRGLLGDRGLDLTVAHAMRYGEPSLPRVLRGLREKNLARLLVLPLYPQYAASTTASAFDAIAAELRGWRNLPELRLVRSFHREPGYIQALAAQVRRHWQRNGRGEKLVMSFHGIPRRSLDRGDPYHCECHATGRLLAAELGLGSDAWIVTFQSRFGRARWLEPYTEPTVVALARGGIRKLDVVCPGFVSDCLETLEEISMEVRAAFLGAGGEQFNYIECLNESAEWIAALADLVERHAAGWPVARLPDDLQSRREAALVEREALAKARGAAT